MSITQKIISESFTYDDVLLIPQYSEVIPREVDTVSLFSRHVPLNVPIVSAAMDTVTESSMAIAIAREGGIGVLHKNMSIEKQAKQVQKVKRSESGVIIDPISLPLDAKVEKAISFMKKYGIGGIPIVDKDNVLKGIVTNRDLRFEYALDKPLSDIMTKELITAKEGISLADAEDILKINKIEKLPVVNEKNQLVGLITYRDFNKVNKNPSANKDMHGRLLVAAAVGIATNSLERIEALYHAGVDAIVIDTAHGHTKNVAYILKDVKNNFPKLDVVVGNIATGKAAKFLVDQGADGIKVGIGPGSICTTRIVAGVGYPQLSAILEAVEAIEGSGVPIIADGGIRYTGDIPKAIAAGADSVMLGSLLAGTKESPGETIIYEGRKYKSYRGMGSLKSMQKGSKDRYFQDMEDDIKKFVPEGIEGQVAYKGEVCESMHQFVGGLRAGMGYCGAKDINALKKARFVHITTSGMQESHPHNIMITKEAPNYSRNS